MPRSIQPRLRISTVVFCNGHVESPTLAFLFTDTSAAALCRRNRDHQTPRAVIYDVGEHVSPIFSIFEGV